MKIAGIILFIIMSLIFVNSVSAITTYAEWQNKEATITIKNGERVYFDYALFSMNPPMQYNVRLYDHNSNLIKTIAETTTNENFVSKREYIDENDYLKTGSFKLVVYGKDNLDDVSSSTINLIVSPITVNHPPKLDPIGNKQVNEGQLLKFEVTATDQDDDKIFLTAKNLPRGAIFKDNKDGTGDFKWQTDFDDSGIYNIIFSASDGGLEDSESIIINVIDVSQNNLPNLMIIAPKENEIINGVYNILWQATDIDQPDQTLDIKIEYLYNGYGWFVLEDSKDNNEGIFTWDTTKLSDSSDYKIRITVKDNDNNKVSKTVNFIVDNLFSPNVQIIAPKENEVINGVYNILWQAADIDQLDLTLDIKIEYRCYQKNVNLFGKVLNMFVLSNKNGWIILEDDSDNNDGIYKWDTRSIKDEECQLRIIAEDDDGNTGTGFVNLFMIYNMIMQNNNPVIISTPKLNAIVGELYNYDVDATDRDNDILTYSLLNYPIGMSIEIDTGLISWVPYDEGSYAVAVVVKDDKGGFDQQSFVISVVKKDQPAPVPKQVTEKHRFMISDLRLKEEKDNEISVFINLVNKGNNKENILLTVTDVTTGNRVQENIKLSYGGIWNIIKLKNISGGRHIIKVDATSKDFNDVKYAFIHT